MIKDDEFWVNTAYMIVALIFGYIIFRAINTLGIQMSWVERYNDWFPLANNLGAIFAGVAGVLWFRSSEARREYHLAAVAEARKVTWPTAVDTKRLTIVVVVVVAVFAVILGVFDFAWSWALRQIIA